jgi:hypothetical protein
MKMKSRVAVAVLLFTAMVVLGFSGSAVAQGFSVTITVDENGHGRFTNTTGFSSALPFALVPDPGPGGLASTLTYDTLNPPGLVPGDVLLQDPFGAMLDVVRFNASSFTGGTGSLVFYSDNLDGFDALGDTPGPPGALYANNVTIPELGTEQVNGAVYTPLAGQPGFVAGASGPVTYVLLSDTPEPSSLLLLGSGLFGVAGVIRRKLSV